MFGISMILWKFRGSDEDVERRFTEVMNRRYFELYERWRESSLRRQGLFTRRALVQPQSGKKIFSLEETDREKFSKQWRKMEDIVDGKSINTLIKENRCKRSRKFKKQKIMDLISRISEPQTQYFDIDRRFNPLYESETDAYRYQAKFDRNGNVQEEMFTIFKRMVDGMPFEEYHHKFVEDLYMLIVMLYRARTAEDTMYAVMVYVKLRTNRAFVNKATLKWVQEAYYSIFGYVKPEGGIQIIDLLRKGLTHFEDIQQSPLWDKLYKFGMYLMSCSLLKNFGIDYNSMGYTKLQEAALKAKFNKGPEMIKCFIDTVLFILERGHQIYVTGDYQCMFHSSSSYEEWYNRVSKLKMQAKCLKNPEDHGFTESAFTADLLELIEQGENIYKHALNKKGIEKRIVFQIVEDLKFIKGNFLTSKKAAQTRESPFSIMLFGDSGIGKSSLQRMLAVHFGKKRGLRTESDYFYSKNCTAKHWDGFSSKQWGILLDDVAFQDPGMKILDPSVAELLQVVNNIPYVPAQAVAEDKGKIPLLCKFVIATSNTPSLNAFHYFSCPSAVQRRLPFIIEPKVRPEFCDIRNGTSLDPSLTSYVEGEYPDYWTFDVTKVSARSFSGDIKLKRQDGIKTKILQGATLKEFLVWYNKAIDEHYENQNKAQNCMADMEKVSLCERCWNMTKDCSCETQSGSPVTKFLKIYWQMTELIMSSAYEILCNKFMEYIGGTKLFFWICNLFNINIYKFVLNKLGDNVKRNCQKLATLSDADLAKVTFLCMLVPSLYMAYKNMTRKPTKEEWDNVIPWSEWQKKSMNQDYVPRTHKEMGMQYAQTSKIPEGKAPEADEFHVVNQWYRDSFELSEFDTSPQIESCKGMNDAQITQLFAKNAFHVTIFDLDTKSATENRMVGLKGQYYLINNHAIQQTGKLIMKVTSKINQVGIGSNSKVILDESDIFRFPEKDLAIIRIRSLPPVKNIIPYFGTNNVDGRMPGMFLRRDKNGELISGKIEKCTKFNDFNFQYLDIKIDVWEHNFSTQKGDCGSMIIGKSARGPIILGIHELGSSLSSSGLAVYRGWLENRLREITKGVPIIESGVPVLSAPGYPVEIGELHAKSVARFHQSGVANVYGSSPNFRPGNKSRVVETPICETMKDYGYKIKFTQPKMKGWQTWQIGFTDMINPVMSLKSNVLREVTQNYIDDIKANLPKGTLERLLHPLDMFTTVNGAANVAFIDKINRQTSAGNPLKKSKKYFFHPVEPTETAPDPIEFDNLIMDRVHHMEATYIDGKRVMPCFCAHLKDEPVSFKKAEIGKTRIFTGAPVDWTIVVRKYLLSMCRLVQNHKYAFEAAPGTVAQSIEWQQMYEYLVAHGEHKIVAGDYKAFDKRMPASVILAAFDVIIALCEASGNYNEDSMKVVCGIAQDTAFPLVEFNGDFIEFFGSNPSGHPLTVIINSLANSIYMRYCYHELNPNHEAETFKDNVNLMTYGDDNIMGVSDRVPWFNHTTIANTLAAVDIVYTMAEKEAISVPYIHISEASFLKRTWRFDKNVGAMLCPLDHDSIEKMLTVWVASKSVVWQEQIVSVIASACREYFFYGKPIFEEKRLMFKAIIAKHELSLWENDSTLPVWDQLNNEFWKYSKAIVARQSS